jgi:hypothetical protein
MQMLEKNRSAFVQESRKCEETYEHNQDNINIWNMVKVDTGPAFDQALSKAALHQVLILRQVLQLYG